MIRKALRYLQEWINSRDRKPIILLGARQVGKTHTVRDLAKIEKYKLVEINFEKEIDAESLFNSNDPKEIIINIESRFNIDIDIKNTILFLDEIQSTPKLIAKLRWFAEDMPALAIIAAGSLLDFVLNEYSHSMPVGRITYLYMNPLSFEEFLLANGHLKLLEHIETYNINKKAPEAIHNKLTSIFKEYIITGGMPAVVDSWRNNHSSSEIQRLQADLYTSYRDDFAKYAGKISIQRLDDILLAIPRMLGKKFKWSTVNNNVKSASLKQALNLLNEARVCNKVIASHANGLPLLSEADARNFKVIFLDVGLVSSQLGLMLHQIRDITDINLINKGDISEQVVGQLLKTISPLNIDPQLCYWIREKKSSNAEVDYVIQHNNIIIPIEVKSGKTGTLKSLHLFMHEKQLNKAVRINSDITSTTIVKTIQNQKEIEYNLLSIPMYLVGQLHRLLEQL